MGVQGFDSFEDMWAELEKNIQAADARAEVWQKEIKVGDWFITAYSDLIILNHVLGMVDDKGCENYRYCRSYSQAVPNGESGDVHVSSAIVPICPDCASIIGKTLGLELSIPNKTDRLKEWLAEKARVSEATGQAYKLQPEGEKSEQWHYGRASAFNEVTYYIK